MTSVDSVEMMKMETQPSPEEEEMDGVEGGGGGGEASPVGAEPGEEDKEAAAAFDCNVCGRSFPFQSSLSQHMRRHTGSRPFKCPYCDHRASQKGNLKVHIRSHKLGTLTSQHPDEEGEGPGGEEEEEGSEEVGVSEGLEGGTSPTKSSSACNRVVNGDGGAGAEESRRKVAARGAAAKREKPAAEKRPYCCRLCGFEAQREDQLLSHIEKVHITADTEDPDAQTQGETTEAGGGGGEAEGEAGGEVAAVTAAAVAQNDGTFPCETCGQVFTQAWFLKSHMKKHAGLLEHCCKVCGRRFREAWFLKSHMKTHNGQRGSARGARGGGGAKAESEPRATINDVAQEPSETPGLGLGLYQLCSKCGNLFHDKESLRAHEKVHGPQNQQNQNQNQRRRSEDEEEDSPAAKRRLLDYLNLRPAPRDTPDPPDDARRVGRRIPELDPVCSYQAWQLATRGRVLEPQDVAPKSASAASLGEEALSGAAVVYEKESSRYVLAGHQERRGGASSARARNHGNSPGGDWSPESLSDSEYRPSVPRQERRRSSGAQAQAQKPTECFECGKVFRSRHQMMVHQRVHQRRDGGGGGRAAAAGERAGRGERWGSTSDPESGGSPSRPSTPGYGDSPPPPPPASALRETANTEAGSANPGQLADVKPYVCSLCDFATPDTTAFLSHVRLVHTPPDPQGRPGPLPSPGAPPSSGFPKLKTTLLLPQGPAPSASTPPPPRPPYLSARTSADKRPRRSPSPADPLPAPLDLCVREAGRPRGPPSAPLENEPAGHKCSFCSHSTRYPEVLWMHQTVAHRISGSSSTLAPKWAPRSGHRGPKNGPSSSSSSGSRRRTGPPPALEGKECPPLAPVVRNPRTRPPAGGSAGGQKKDRAAASSSPASSSSSSSSSRGSTTAGSQGARPAPQRPAGTVTGTARGQAEGQASRSRPKVEMYPRVSAHSSSSSSSSSMGSLEKSTASQRPSANPSPGAAAAGGGARAGLSDRYALPREGLGFVLSSKHGLAEYGQLRGAATADARGHAHNQGKARPSQPQAQARSQGRAGGGGGAAGGQEPPAYSSSYGGSQLHAAAIQASSSSSSSSSSGLRGEMKQEAPAETPEVPMDIVSYLKNYNPHELAALYHRWGSANPLLDPTGMLRSLMRQGEYVCQECGKSFSQPSHLRTHMRSHTVGYDFNGHHRGSDGHSTSSSSSSSETPKQVRERSAAASARTESLSKGS